MFRPAGLAMLLSLACVSGAAAHPHVWIDTTVEVVLDDEDRVVAVRIGWIYDAYFSMAVIADHGLDQDADLELDADEVAALSGFDMDWEAGHPGDSYALIDSRALVLGPPEDWTAAYRDGSIMTTHLRRLPEPVEVGTGTFVVQVYDPGFYTDYSIVGDPVLTGGSGACTAGVWEPDPDAADEELRSALSEYAPDQDVEADFPAVGRAFADEVRLTCPAR
jgi:polyphosphate kinase